MRAIDLLFALRPLLWIPAVALYAAGALGPDRAPAGTLLLAHRALWALLLLLGVVHLLNGWRDREGDRRNGKGLPIATEVVGPAPLLLLGIAAGVAAIVLGAGCSERARGLLLAAGALGVAYTVPPIELKRRAGFDLASHAVGYGVLAYFLGAEAGGRLEGSASVATALVSAIPYALGIGSVAVGTMLADQGGDAAAGQRTLAVRIGPAGASRLEAGLAWGAMAWGLALGDWVPFLWGFVTAVSRSVADGSGSRQGRAPVATQVIFLALLAARSPEPLAFAVVVGMASAVYYRARWGLRYPVRLGATG